MPVTRREPASFSLRPRPLIGFSDHFRQAAVCKTVRFDLCYRTAVLSVCNDGVLWPNGWMDQDATWYGGRPRPRRYCVRWGPSSLHGKGHSSPPPTFRPVSIVAKRL